MWRRGLLLCKRVRAWVLAAACRVMDYVSVARRVPPTRYAQSAGAKIAFQVSGEGQCDLVFVPGLVSHLELQWQQLSYRRFVTALERACRVIRFDKRGTGLSDPTDALPSMDQRVADLAAVMDAAGSQTAVVFGVSDGGRGAVAFAAAHPGRVLGLVLSQARLRQARAAFAGGAGRGRRLGQHQAAGYLISAMRIAREPAHSPRTGPFIARSGTSGRPSAEGESDA
jgi:pimeloyl-ACP methyl ester carboxylesterase